MRHAWLSALLAGAAWATAQSSLTPNATLIVSQDTITPDCTPRLSTVVNGTSPGPPLRFRAGDHVFIRVINNSTSMNTTIHLHGLTEYLSPFADGTPLTAQWPIPPMGYFDYELMLGNGSAGSYFYHSHIGIQAATAYGAFIVDEADGVDPPYQYDEDRIVLLADNYHENDTTIIDGLTGDPFKWANEPQALLVNGQGLGKGCNASALLPGQQCSTNCSYNNIQVDYDKTYRFRVIYATALSYDSIGFEGHSNLTLIEADARYLQSYNVSHIEGGTGQRYSFLMKTKTQAEVQADNSNGSYWAAVATRWRPMKTQGYAVLTYASNPPPISTPVANITSGVTLPNETFGWVTGDLAPLSDYDEFGQTYPNASEVTRRIILKSQQVNWFASQKGSRWQVDGEFVAADGGEDEVYYYSNNGTNETAPVPFLVQLYTQQYTPNYTYALANGGRDLNGAYPVKKGEVLEIVIENETSGSGQAEAHPWHQHGQHYWFIANGHGNWSVEAAEAALANRTGKPFLRDSVVVYPGPGASYLGTAGQINGTDGKAATGAPAGWAVWRLKVVDAGSWLLHCHILFHMTMGMQSALVFGAEDLPQLPADYMANYLTYNATQPASPMAYFGAGGAASR